MKSSGAPGAISNAPLDQSGVWRYREMIPFLETPVPWSRSGKGTRRCSPRPRAADTADSTGSIFKHQGFNPTGSFKDNGMTCGVAQARRLGMRRVACVSTGNTSASMAAYASAAGIEPLIFIPARQHLLRQAGAGARIRRANVSGGSELRPDPGAGPRARRTAWAFTC